MNNRDKETRDLRRKLRAVVPSSISGPLSDLIDSWISKSGTEWTIGRLKDIKTDFIRLRAGQSLISPWVARTRRRFKGVFGILQKYSESSRQNYRRAIAALNCYTYFLSPKPTAKQAKKFMDGVTATPTPIQPEVYLTLLDGIQRSGLRFRSLPQAESLLSSPVRPDKRAPVPTGSVPEDEGLIDSILFLREGGGLNHLQKYLHLYEPVFSGLEPELEWIQLPWKVVGSPANAILFPDKPFTIGKIGLIQEPGFKLRAVANPGRVFQSVTDPLKKSLLKCLQSLPWDCTHDQTKADSIIQEHLKKGLTCYSVDLSGATDYFPLELQEIVLRELFPGDHVSLFIDLSRCNWIVPKSLQKLGYPDTIRWTKGQPLGLGPSFASFALTHGVLLLGLLGKKYNYEFFVLGDDVVILDDGLYLKYRSLLKDLDCPVSEPKTLVSSKVAEFHSSIITADDIFRQPKWRSLSDINFVDIIRNQPWLQVLAKPRQRRVLDAIKELPAELGGLGYNPSGLPLEKRIAPFLPWLLGDKPIPPRDTEYIGRFTRYLLKSSISRELAPYSQISRSVVDTLAQRARRYVVTILGPYLEPLYRVLGKNLVSVFSDADLPIQGSNHGISVALDEWEAILRKLGLLT